MPDDRKPSSRTPPRGLALSDDARDRLVPKHRTPELSAPHEVPHETTSVYARRKLDSVSTTIDQLKIDQIRQNNELGELRSDVAVVTTKVEGLDEKLDIVTDLVRNRARTDTAHLEAELKIKTVEHEDKAGKSKLRRNVLGAIVAALGALAGAAAHYLAGHGG